MVEILETELVDLERVYREGNINIGKNIFSEARDILKQDCNRKKMIAVVDDNEKVLFYLAWNQIEEKEEVYLHNCIAKLRKCIAENRSVVFDIWDEYTDLFLNICLKESRWGGNLFVHGKFWKYSSKAKNIKEKKEINSEILVDARGIHFPTKEKTVHALNKIAGRYRNNKVFVFLSSRLSLYVLQTMIFSWGYRPDGYCQLPDCEDDLEEFLGQKVHDISSIDANTIVLASELYELPSITNYVERDRIVFLEQLFVGDKKKYSMKFQIQKDENIKNYIKKYPDIKQCLVQEKDNVNEYPQLLLWSERLNRNSNYYSEYIKTIIPNTELYSDRKVYETEGCSDAPLKFTIFDNAIREKKVFVLFGCESHYTNRWIRILELFRCKYIHASVDEDVWNGMEIKSIYDVLYDYNQENLVVINNCTYDKLIITRNDLEKLGFSYEKHNYLSIYAEADCQDRGGTCVDFVSGPMPQCLANQKYPGYKIIGNEDEAKFKIMVLGGSTSDSTLYNFESWPEILHKLFIKNGSNTVIYNGAVGGYYSGQELSKLAREIRIFKPDAVISFSGVNDFIKWRLLPGYFNGAYYKYCDNLVSNWIENEKIMYMIALQYSAEFFCFAQPQLVLKSNMSREEKLLTKDYRFFQEKEVDIKRKVSAIAKDQDLFWFYDFIEILDNDTYTFFDAYHVTTKGNEIIAKKIFEKIMERLYNKKVDSNIPKVNVKPLALTDN